jgi:hypothetical protein
MFRLFVLLCVFTSSLLNATLTGPLFDVDFLQTQLSLSDTQLTQIHHLNTTYDQKYSDLFNQYGLIINRLHVAEANPDINTEFIIDLTEKLDPFYASITTLRTSYLQEIKTHLTPSQNQILDAL